MATFERCGPSDKRPSRAIWIAAFALVAATCHLTVVAQREPRLKEVISRLDTYLDAYETDLTSLIAEERYEQWIQTANTGAATSRRTLTSDFGFLRLPGRPEWLGLRDTFAVDDEPIPDRQGRLERLLSDTSSDVPTLARRIVEENARYNLGTVARTINVPMLALDLLGRRNRDRFSLRKRSEDRLEGRMAWVVDFNERDRPTLVKTPGGGNRPAHGAAWIDPSDGAVLRTEVEFDERGGDSPAASISVLYQRESALGLLVPYEMKEVYRMETGERARDELHAVARYTNFRRFGTSARIVPR